jgi:hypothetical protein
LATSDILLLLVVLCGLTVLQFFKGRKDNLALMRIFSHELETAIAPKDKVYTWLGGYIGFKASYAVGEGMLDRVEATLTLLPRHSLLYFPIALLISKRDRLYLVFRVQKKLSNETHIIEKRYKRTRKINNELVFNTEEINVSKKNFKVLYETSEIAKTLVSWFKNLDDPSLIKHVAIVPKTNVFYIFMKPVPGLVEDYVKNVMGVLRSATF